MHYYFHYIQCNQKDNNVISLFGNNYGHNNKKQFEEKMKIFVST